METEILFNGRLGLTNVSCTETGFWQINFNNMVNFGTFGITTNSDGSYSIFTRGVDRVQYRSLEWLADWTMEQGAFGPADNLWHAFQERLVQFIDDNSFPGNASKIEIEPKRVDVDEVHSFIFGDN